MLHYHPSGTKQQAVETSLGTMVYYTAIAALDETSTLERPPLLFLHNFGGGASAYEWSKVYPAFTGHYQTIAPDLIGWGCSAHPIRDYCIEDYLTTLTEFITQTCDRPVIAIASSLTGAIVIRLAIQRPNLFKGLFLVCPSGFADFGQNAGRRLPLSAIKLPLLDQVIYTAGAMNEFAVRNFLERFLFANPNRVSPEMVAAYLESASQPNAQFSALSFLRGDLYFDLARYVPQLTVPTAMIWGEAAQFTSASLGERIAGLNPIAIHWFMHLQAAGILPHLEQPAIAIGILQQFLTHIQQKHTREPFDPTSLG